MSPPPSREEALFTDALAQPAARRAEFLDQACGPDAVMRLRIEALLAAHDAPEELIEPALPAAHFAAIPDEKPGDMIGRYKLLQKIGEGGCGVVYMAAQAEPVRRRVALKVIKAGMDTREVIARFAAERQALALMDHAGIAKVLDAGATDAGRPFFVMELVRGLPITKYCDAQNFTTAARIELFMQVCHAVQHAHQKGVIHRDIKPSNILVTLHDATAVPKVIDFGIAKATQGRLSDSTLVTALEQFIGTPAYMSPEQAEMSGLDIDTRSDVYSLGVLLYELLAGRPPFDPKSLSQSSRDEIRRIIREVEPPKPSTQLATLASSDRDTVARLRGTEPAKLRLLLAGDLDWIVMKALEKNRARRYETPAALAADLARYLAHEPVVARPPSKVYRLGKLIRRNRLAFAASVAIALTLIGGAVAATWQAFRATRAEQLAGIEQRRAEAEQARAEKLVTFMLGDMRKQLTRLGRLDVLEAVGNEAMTYFGSLDARNVSDTMLTRHAQALTQIGEIRVARAKFADAAESFRAAYSRAALLVARSPRNGDMLLERGQAEYWIGFVLRKQDDAAGALKWLTLYRDTCVALAALDPKRPDWQSELAWGHHNVAVVDLDSERLEAARDGFSAELEILNRLAAASPGNHEFQSRVADAHSYLGNVAEHTGDLNEALVRYAELVARIAAIVRADPDTAPWKTQLTAAHELHADVLGILGRRAESHAERTRAKTLIETLVASDPHNSAWLQQALFLRLREARLMLADGDKLRAREIIAPVREKLEKLMIENPSDRDLSAQVALALRLHAESTDGTDRAEAVMRSIQLLESLIQDGRATQKTVGDAARSRIIAGTIAADEGNQSEASRHWMRALELMDPYLSRSNHWVILDPAAQALALLGRTAESQAIIERLNRFGYRPPVPWPKTAAAHSSVSNNHPQPR